MNQAPISLADFKQRMVDEHYCFRLGPFVVDIQSDVPAVVEGLWRFYAEYPQAGEDDYADFHVRLYQAPGFRRWFRPQALFSMDGRNPFKPLPLNQAFPMFEWTLNWCVSHYANQYLIFHAAVLERDGVTAILAASSGTGKSTLCAALANKGWRLFTDELALVDLETGRVVPFPRPVGLKNESINIIRNYLPNAIVGPSTHDTQKGTVAHMKPPADSIVRAQETARPGWVVFPRYVADAKVSVGSVDKVYTCFKLIQNSFNYHVLGEEGFGVLTDLVDRSDCLEFAYGHLDDAIAVFDQLTPPSS